MRKKIHFVFIALITLCSCGGNENYIPKPPTYLELNLPSRTYEVFEDECGYSYNKPSYFDVKNVQGSACNRDVKLSSLNGTLHLSRIDMDTSLAQYVNYAIDKVGEHKIKATAIYDTSFYRNESNVYGTLFELKGNVASPFQFYVTDSVSRFISGVVYFNSRPNYDSIKPTLDFVKKDLYGFISSIEWDQPEAE